MHDSHDQARKADPICDISERREAVYALQKSEERYQRIIEAITDYIYTVRVTNGYATETVHGPGCIAVTGYDANEFANDPFLWFRMVATDDRPKVEEQARRILAGQDPPPIEHRIFHKNGTVRWVRNTFVPHHDEQGALVSYDGLILDITERKQAEVAMLESEAKFRSFVENAPDGIFLTDMDQNYQLVNPAACAMTGYTAEEFAHMNICDLVPSERMVEARAVHDRLVEDGRLFLELRLKRKDGSTFWATLDAVKIDENHLLAFCKDITERKQADEALRASNEKFAKIYHLSPDAIDLTHLETGVQVEANQSYLEMSGYTREELIGRSTLPGDLGTWVNKENRDRHVASLKEHGEDIEFEALQRRKDGSIFMGLISSSLMEMNGEQYNLSIIRDISERKKAEEALQESDTKNRALIIAISDLIFSFNREGVYLNISTSTPSLLVGPMEVLLGTKLTDILPGPIAEQWLNAIGKALDLRVVQELEYSLLLAGEEKYFEARLTPSANDEVIAIVRDITERKQAAEHQRLLEAQLQQSQKMESLGTLVAGVAHNINNVLSVIMGTASLREDSATELSDRAAYQIIGKVCNRGREVVKSLIHCVPPVGVRERIVAVR